MTRFLLALLIVAGLASTAAAHHGVPIRRTPLNPFRGPVPIRASVGVHHGVPIYSASLGFRQPLHYHGGFRQDFRYGYSAPFFAPQQFYYQPQPIVIQAPQPIVVQQPQQIVYAEQPSLNYSQGYSYSSGSQNYYGGTQAIRQEAVYRLPDGRLVLPSGQVIDQ